MKDIRVMDGIEMCRVQMIDRSFLEYLEQGNYNITLAQLKTENNPEAYQYFGVFSPDKVEYYRGLTFIPNFTDFVGLTSSELLNRYNQISHKIDKTEDLDSKKRCCLYYLRDNVWDMYESKTKGTRIDKASYICSFDLETEKNNQTVAEEIILIQECRETPYVKRRGNMIKGIVKSVASAISIK